MCAGAGAGGGAGAAFGGASATGNQGIGSQGQFGGTSGPAAAAFGGASSTGNQGIGSQGQFSAAPAPAVAPTSSGVAGNIVRPPATPPTRPAASTALTVNTIAAEIGRSPGDVGPTPNSNTGGQNEALKRFGASTFLTLNNTKRKTALGV